MAAAGEEGFWTKLAKDLTSLRVCTIVAREIRGGQVPPEPAVMLWEIAQVFGQCLTELQGKQTPLSGVDNDILSRIETGCASIGRLYANIDARARTAQVQSTEAVQKYQQTMRAQPAALDVRAAWGGGVDRRTFAGMELQSKRLLNEVEAPRSVHVQVEGQPPPQGTGWEGTGWEEEAPRDPLPAPAVTGVQPPPIEPASLELVASAWPIVPERLAAPTPGGLRSVAPAADQASYQAACRTLFRLEPDEVVVLRKIWELGTDVVLMETVIQLDGDVVSRIRQNHQSDVNLQSVHRQMLDVAMNNWHFMADAVGKLIDVLTKSLVK
jgi:hypothetical protein